MLKYLYKYKKVGEGLFRPLIPIALRNNDKDIFYLALIDSGSDFNIFHLELAEVIGVDLKKAKRVEFGGIKSGAPAVGFFVSVELGIRSHKDSDSVVYFNAPVIFSKDISSDGYGIVGQIGFFDRFKITMNYVNKAIELERKEDF